MTVPSSPLNVQFGQCHNMFSFSFVYSSQMDASSDIIHLYQVSCGMNGFRISPKKIKVFPFSSESHGQKSNRLWPEARSWLYLFDGSFLYSFGKHIFSVQLQIARTKKIVSSMKYFTDMNQKQVYDKQNVVVLGRLLFQLHRLKVYIHCIILFTLKRTPNCCFFFISFPLNVRCLFIYFSYLPIFKEVLHTTDRQISNI